MTVFVYRSLKKDGYYLYLREKDKFDRVPQTLMSALGKLEFALDFDLSQRRTLATENPKKVADNLASLGYHLQITDPLAAMHLNDKTTFKSS